MVSAAALGPSDQNKDFMVIIQAKDRGTPQMSATTTVRLTITGLNSYTPEFVASQVKQVAIPESYDVGAEIARVSATDRDRTGPNGQVRYFITEGNSLGLYVINAVSGAITVEKDLDYETKFSHVLTVTARDMGLPSKESSMEFRVILTDVNDNPPMFDQSEYTVYVKENTPSGQFIAKLTATDADTGENARIEYAITPSSVLFTLGRATCNLKTLSALDYETRRSYDITITAKNPGTSLTDTALVHVQVESVNEFYPVFNQLEYRFVINESAPDKSPVGSVSAYDQDQGPDGEVFYYLIGASNNMAFKIHYSTGLITVSGKPDYESSPNITLKVMAKNRASVQGNDTDQCTVFISVKDANDAPTFSEPLYKATIQEDVQSGQVIQVSATDNDHKDSDKQFSFIILGGDLKQAFSIDSTSGWITVRGSLDRETLPVYNLTVGAVDTGTPPMTGGLTLSPLQTALV